MTGEENSRPAEAHPSDELVRLSPGGVRNWFWVMTKRVIEAGSQARLDKYRIPGLPEDVVADQLVRNKASVSAIIGALAGLGTSTSQIFAIPTFGATLAIWGGVALVEMGGLSLLQLRMVQDLSVLYNVKLDPDDPQDMLTIFSFALGIKPSEALAPAAAKMAGEAAKQAIKKFISKDVLKAIQRLASKVGVHLLQRTIIKYAVPGVSVVVGALINHVSTRSLGKVAKVYFSRRGLKSDLFRAIGAETTYYAAFPAVALYTAKLDKEFAKQEQELYRTLYKALKDRFTSEDEKLLKASAQELEAYLQQIEDPVARQGLLDLAVIMAMSDGKLSLVEKDYITHIASILRLPVNMGEVEELFEALYPPGIGGCLTRFAKLGCLVTAILSLISMIGCAGGAYLVIRLLSQ